MSILPRFDPPANWTGEMSVVQLAAWSAFISNTVDAEINGLKGIDYGIANPQFFNATKVDQTGAVTDPIPWQGFPKKLERAHGGFTEAALKAAEPSDLPQASNRNYKRVVRFRPQDEYCEWRLVANGGGRPIKYIFTSEPPEYWETLAEGYPQTYTPAAGDPPSEKNHALVLKLYRELVGPEVNSEDLFPNGVYDGFNRFNTTDGIVHLTHPANTLGAEIDLAARSTATYSSGGTPITDETQLIGCNGAGDKDRASDPHISQRVNSYALDGYYVSVLNPMGL